MAFVAKVTVLHEVMSLDTLKWSFNRVPSFTPARSDTDQLTLSFLFGGYKLPVHEAAFFIRGLPSNVDPATEAALSFVGSSKPKYQSYFVLEELHTRRVECLLNPRLSQFVNGLTRLIDTFPESDADPVHQRVIVAL